jgi:hypothetical protein
MAPVRYRTADVDGFKVFYRETGPAGAPKLRELQSAAPYRAPAFR